MATDTNKPKEILDITGEPIKEGDIVMWIKPKRNKFGHYHCRANLVIKPLRLTGLPLVGVGKSRNGYERPLPKATDTNVLTIVGRNASGVDHEKSAALQAIAKERSEQWDE